MEDADDVVARDKKVDRSQQQHQGKGPGVVIEFDRLIRTVIIISVGHAQGNKNLSERPFSASERRAERCLKPAI
jgi:hypothetical protein